MSIEDVYKGGISTGGVPVMEGIIKHEIKGKRSDVLVQILDKSNLATKRLDGLIEGNEVSEFDENSLPLLDDADAEGSAIPPLMEGIVGEVVKKPRDEAHSTVASGQRWTTENNAHKLRADSADKAKKTGISTKSRVTERVVPSKEG